MSATVADLVWSFVARAKGEGLNDDPHEVIRRTEQAFAEGRYPGGLEAFADEVSVPWPVAPELLEASAAAGRARWETRRRDAAIVAALDAGHSARVVGEAVGLSHAGVLRVRDRA